MNLGGRDEPPPTASTPPKPCSASHFSSRTSTWRPGTAPAACTAAAASQDGSLTFDGVFARSRANDVAAASVFAFRTTSASPRDPGRPYQAQRLHPLGRLLAGHLEPVPADRRTQRERRHGRRRHVAASARRTSSRPPSRRPRAAPAPATHPPGASRPARRRPRRRPTSAPAGTSPRPCRSRSPTSRSAAAAPGPNRTGSPGNATSTAGTPRRRVSATSTVTSGVGRGARTETSGEADGGRRNAGAALERWGSDAGRARPEPRPAPSHVQARARQGAASPGAARRSDAPVSTVETGARRSLLRRVSRRLP